MVVVQHVPHREPEQMQIVLNAQQLERILAVPIDQVALKHTQAGNLAIDVDRVGHDGRERQDQPNQEAGVGDRLWGEPGGTEVEVSESEEAKCRERSEPRAASREFDTAPERSRS